MTYESSLANAADRRAEKSVAIVNAQEDLAVAIDEYWTLSREFFAIDRDHWAVIEGNGMFVERGSATWDGYRARAGMAFDQVRECERRLEALERGDSDA